MARNRVFSRRLWSENLDCSDPSPMHSEDLHILAVDDSLVDRKFIERLLRISSCKVTAVDSGRRALQFLGLDDEKRSVGFDALKVNMIITDYCMPGMTGYELLKRIKESSTFREIPVVIMSSDNILTRIDRCLEEGAEEYLVKPVKLSDVKRLKDYITKMEKKVTEHKGSSNFKRKFLDACDNSSSSSSTSSRSVSPSPPPSPRSSPSASSLSPPLPSSSPSLLESPTRRLRSDTE